MVKDLPGRGWRLLGQFASCSRKAPPGERRGKVASFRRCPAPGLTSYGHILIIRARLQLGHVRDFGAFPEACIGKFFEWVFVVVRGRWACSD